MPSAAKEAIIAKFRELGLRYAELRQIIGSAEEELEQIRAKAQACRAASNLFGFELKDVVVKNPDGSSTIFGILYGGHVRDNPTKRQSIKELVLILAKKAHPEPVRASSVRQTLEEIRGEKLHDKTIGMTLYRLLKEGKLRREGWDWYFIKKDT